jgi:hypothetical protein
MDSGNMLMEEKDPVNLAPLSNTVKHYWAVQLSVIKDLV